MKNKLKFDYIKFAAKETENAKNHMKISVIVPTLNRSQLLERMLRSMLTQTISRDSFEVIVVDNGSVDNTKDVVDRYSQLFLNLFYVYEGQKGLHAGRHAGLLMAKGSILVYADDDIIPESSWLSSLADAFDDEKVGLATGKVLPDFESDPPAWLSDFWKKHEYGTFLSQYSVMDLGDEVIPIHPNFVWGCNYAVRKELVREFGGFHPDGYPKDLVKYRGDGETSLSESIVEGGYKCLYLPNACVHHWVSDKRLRIDYMRDRGFAQGISDSYTYTRWNRAPMARRIYYAKMFFHAFQQVVNYLVKGRHTEAYREYCDGYRNGFAYHQKELRVDPSLVRWVLKDNYL